MTTPNIASAIARTRHVFEHTSGAEHALRYLERVLAVDQEAAALDRLQRVVDQSRAGLSTGAESSAVLAERDATIADLDRKLDASEAERQHLQVEAAKCAAGNAGLAVQVAECRAANVDLGRKLIVSERECQALRRAAAGGLAFVNPATETLHAILAGIIASVGTEDGPALGDAVRNAAKAFKFGLAVFDSATISPEALAADESFASTAAKLRAANAELEQLRAHRQYTGPFTGGSAGTPSASQSAGVVNASSTAIPPPGMGAGYWQAVVGSSQRIWIESGPPLRTPTRSTPAL